jgi:hypothetical protein
VAPRQVAVRRAPRAVQLEITLPAIYLQVVPVLGALPVGLLVQRAAQVALGAAVQALPAWAVLRAAAGRVGVPVQRGR